jgi:hypothetical protein
MTPPEKTVTSSHGQFDVLFEITFIKPYAVYLDRDSYRNREIKTLMNTKSNDRDRNGKK